MSLMTAALFLAGLILLVAGADVLVRGAARLAAGAGISPLVVGLTVVAFGTSAPEMAVSVKAALGGQAGADIAVGNVVGSNIFNVLLILGLAAAISPLAVARKLLRFDVPLMIAVSVLVLLLALDGSIDRWNGALLFAGIVAYTVFAVIQGRREGGAVAEEYANAFAPSGARNQALAVNVLLIAAGLGMLVMGSGWLVDGAVVMARALGISELLIGLTIVAAGTSMPEVATSIMASIRGQRDIAVGNVVGSNLFNLLCVLGLAALVAPGGVTVSDAALRFDIPVMIAVSVACLPIFFTGHVIARWEGWLFLGYYCLYTSVLIFAATGHEGLATLKGALFLFILPLSIVTLAITAIHRK
jgi:cation:H+ antiporter